MILKERIKYSKKNRILFNKRLIQERMRGKKKILKKEITKPIVGQISKKKGAEKNESKNV